MRKNCSASKSLNVFLPSLNGDLSEWLKEHAWKVCIPQKGIEGSNPSVSAFAHRSFSVGGRRLWGFGGHSPQEISLPLLMFSPALFLPILQFLQKEFYVAGLHFKVS
jgi:hypothetical protein